jgi:hypothetical protein
MYDENVKDKVWKAYYEYLVTIDEKVKELRQLYIFDNDSAKTLNSKTDLEKIKNQGKKTKKDK